jgi:tRNA(Ile)-lysidine synthase
MLPEALRRFFDVYRIGPCRILVAVSGGADSTALLLAITDLRDDGFEIVCGHVNHHIRGAEADEDEAFVRSTCERLGVPFHVADGSLDSDAVRSHGVEAAARAIRTSRLQEVRADVGAGFIATAHQMNDQAETILMRLFTGSGIAGLRGIHPVRDDGFIRPLLGVRRAEIEAFLQSRGVTPRIDAMNTDPRYLRVRIRESLGAYDARTIENIAAVADQARQQWSALEALIDSAEKSFVEALAGQTRFTGWPNDPRLRRALLHRHIQRLDPTREISAADLERIDAELATIQRLTVTKSLELVRRDGLLILRFRPAAETAGFEVALGCGAAAFVPTIATTVAVRPAAAGSERTSADRTTQLIQLPAGAAPEFLVRNRRDGDRFRPLGLGGEKKLKDFLIDRKIAAEERDRIPLVLWNGEIVWVAGIEVADGFKVTTDAGNLYELSIRRLSDSRLA